jgi:hypothetical protein
VNISAVLRDDLLCHDTFSHSPKPFIHNAGAKQRSPMDRQRPYLPTDDGNTHPVAGRSIDLIPPHPRPTGV